MMKRNPIVQILLLICLLTIVPALSVAEENRRDGNWWREQDRFTRSVYIIGFFDGMDLGHNFSYWDFVKDKEMNACMGKVAESYADYSSKYFKNVTNVQLVDGLNSFYTDFRNRSIRIADAVWLVVNGIAGTPQEKLDSMIENWRRHIR
jgi:hypothetical protein